MREVQIAQERAIEDADGERLEELFAQRRALLAAIVPLDRAGLAPADRAEAEALAELLLERDALLAERATARAAGLRAEVGRVAHGRSALAGYRSAPPPVAVGVDSAC